jgi:hypothetical protein
MRQIDKLYTKYEFLADIYARKVFNLSCISYEREDIIQDFRIKLFSTIVSYVKQFDKFLKGVRNRPMPLEIYLKLALSNFVKDFIKKMNTNKHNGWDSYLSQERDDYDCGYREEQDCDNGIKEIANFKISNFRDDLTIVLNGFDMLGGLEQKESKIAFILFMKGYKFKTIDQVLKLQSSPIIKEHIENLKEHKERLLDFDTKEFLLYHHKDYEE